MTLSAVCASRVCFPRIRFTGKERDSESGRVAQVPRKRSEFPIEVWVPQVPRCWGPGISMLSTGPLPRSLCNSALGKQHIPLPTSSLPHPFRVFCGMDGRA